MDTKIASWVLACAAVITFAGDTEAKKGGNGNGQGNANGNASWSGNQANVAPGLNNAAPGPSNGNLNNGVGNGMPAVAPNIRRANKYLGGTGNLRSTGQHALNALHPTGQTRANAQHLLSNAKQLYKLNKINNAIKKNTGWKVK